MVEVDAADERDLAGFAGIDDPALLMVAVAREVIPAGPEARVPLTEPPPLVRRSRKVRGFWHEAR